MGKLGRLNTQFVVCVAKIESSAAVKRRDRNKNAVVILVALMKK